MILKILGSKGEQFIYSEISDIETFVRSFEDLKRDEHHKLWLIDENSSKKDYKIIKIFRNNELDIRLVIDEFCKVYLMNNEGKTIERLD